jgi:hypothetical protein
MDKLRKITVQVPKQLLEKEQAYTGENVTRTIRLALSQLASDQSKRDELSRKSS